jgi:steroid delta-isomerase-like uncharacterized protein
MATTDQTEAANIEVVREFHQRVLTEKDLDAAEELIAEDYVEHNPALPGGELAGRENLVEFWQQLFEAFPDLWIKEEDAFAEGETVVTRHVGRGTHEGAFMDLDPTGNEFEIDGIDVYVVEDGRITESWISLDMFGLMQQLGVIPVEEAEEA